MIRVFKTGRHAMRTPLSYSALAPLFADSIELVDDPARADLYVFAHEWDIREAPAEMLADWQARQRPIVLLSEEPFWETIWLKNPIDRHISIDTPVGPVPVIQLNHHTSDIFSFDRIPYYLLTNHRFASAYAYRFTRNAALSAQDWQTRFAARHVDLTFMFERRPEPYHSVRWPEGDVIGLCYWRTAVAEACQTGVVERLGKSWQGGKSRFELSNWHLDKLVQLDGRARMLAAFENTHQPQYLTEKIFDAFACGSMPLYFASPDHALHRMGLPEGSWLNLYDLSEEDAAQNLLATVPDSVFFDTFQQAQSLLRDLFTDTHAFVDERERLRKSVLNALTDVLASPA